MESAWTTEPISGFRSLPETAELVLISAPGGRDDLYGAGAALCPRRRHRSLDAAGFLRSAGPRRLAPRHRHGRRGLFAAGVFAAPRDRRRTSDRPPRRGVAAWRTTMSCARSAASEGVHMAIRHRRGGSFALRSVKHRGGWSAATTGGLGARRSACTSTPIATLRDAKLLQN